ncbi:MULTISPECIES: DUF3853 family protein [unclassified Kaistella]|uniref:DUF3853 family protein n=1 Tax=unclassified Kaistella TaxID=2762626 RepID=UPI00273629B5|nr:MULTISPECIES: DUF3853 family protein [unclassified Kaistella]MDP2453236.1 DUF3853 family protein [Kaistella sp. SH11-4b]MDP2456293.1 DUF3853 family protein [Kaistella sp. SH40-3]MDP2459049.1 DUF3853 family protein [Kaistella sp. SH19-2b]
MNAFEGFNDEIGELITTLDKSDISTIKIYLSDKSLSEKYISALKTECNNMVASEALFYLLGTAQNQLFITKKVKGIMGLATLLNVSVKTAQKLKNLGSIEEAIIYEKSKLYFDENKILEICLPKKKPWKSFKLRESVDEEFIKLWANFSK